MKKFTYLLVALFAAATVFSTVANTKTASATGGCYFEFSKTADKSEVVAGDEITYSIHLKNIGTSDCTGGGVELQESYDPDSIFVGSSLAPTISNSIWNFGTIVPGQEYNFLVKVKVNPNVQPGDTITNLACVWAEQFGSYTDQSVWKCTTATSTVVGNGNGGGGNGGGGGTVVISTTGGGNSGPSGANIPKIKLKKATANPIAYPGQTISYTLTVTSFGTKNADDVTVEDSLPAGFTYSGTNASTKTFQFGNIPNGTDKSISYTVLIATTTVSGVYENFAVATMKDGFAPDNRSEARASVTVEPVSASRDLAQLVVAKTATPSRILSGKNVSYSVVVKNMGVTDAVNVVLRDVLPNGLLFVDTNTAEQTFAVGNLAVNESKTISFTVKTSVSLASGTYRNTAYATSDNTKESQATADVYVENARIGMTSLPRTGMNPFEFFGFGITSLVLVGFGLAMFIRRRKNLSSK